MSSSWSRYFKASCYQYAHEDLKPVSNYKAPLSSTCSNRFLFFSRATFAKLGSFVQVSSNLSTKTFAMENIRKIHSRGIYHGLPVYPDDVAGLTAIVTGATGISGDHMVSGDGAIQGKQTSGLSPTS